jgi:hypothetical protein
MPVPPPELVGELIRILTEKITAELNSESPQPSDDSLTSCAQILNNDGFWRAVVNYQFSVVSQFSWGLLN